MQVWIFDGMGPFEDLVVDGSVVGVRPQINDAVPPGIGVGYIVIIEGNACQGPVGKGTEVGCEDR